jgi:ABC-type nitrate/sulfonate/bicarbonate transport system substrate-binding protein
VDLSEKSVAGLAEFKDFLFEWGFLDADFDIAEWIDPRPLAAVQHRSRQDAA